MALSDILVGMRGVQLRQRNSPVAYIKQVGKYAVVVKQKPRFDLGSSSLHHTLKIRPEWAAGESRLSFRVTVQPQESG